MVIQTRLNMLHVIKNLLKKNKYIKEYLRCKDIVKLYDERKSKEARVLGLFRDEFNDFLNTSKNRRFDTFWEERNPWLNDKTTTIGFDRHYVYHTAWATLIVKQINPENHIDISSFVYFPALLSAFIPVTYYDFRKPELELSNVQAGQADLTALPFASNSVYSLSCMHTVEHIGLGRYGDPLDYEGDLKAINELKRVVAAGGHLLFVVPIGKSKIFFNAHRVYSYSQIIEYFSDMKLVEFTLIKEHSGGLIQHAAQELADAENYACGCFWFQK